MQCCNQNNSEDCAMVQKYEYIEHVIDRKVGYAHSGRLRKSGEVREVREVEGPSTT